MLAQRKCKLLRLLMNTAKLYAEKIVPILFPKAKCEGVSFPVHAIFTLIFIYFTDWKMASNHINLCEFNYQTSSTVLNEPFIFPFLWNAFLSFLFCPILKIFIFLNWFGKVLNILRVHSNHVYGKFVVF